VASSGFLYNIGGLGGVNGVATAQRVFYAPLQDQGGLGSWMQGPSLPEGVFFHAAAAVEGTLLVLGGYHYRDSLVVSNGVYASHLGADGRPGAWQAVAPLPEPAFFLSAGAWNGRVYVTGGWNGQSLTSSVYSSHVNPDGTLEAWRRERSLPQGVYTHAAVAQGTLYVLGGVVNGGSEIHNAVYAARIGEGGALEPWAATTPLPQPLSNHGACVASGRVILAGGWNGASPSDAALQASILPDGGLADWTALAVLPRPLYLHGQAAAGGFLFLSGGSDGQAPQAGVYSIPLPPGPVQPPADTAAPRTTLSFQGPRFGQAPPFISPQTLLSLAAEDDSAGRVRIQYGVDASSLTDYGAPFRLVEEGSHWLRYFGTDEAGNAEAVQVSSVAVDGTAPVVFLEAGAPQAVLTTGEIVLSSQTRLLVYAQDPIIGGAASGVAEVLAGIDAQTPQSVLEPFPLPAVEGPHVVTFSARDNIGNASAPRTSTYFVDQTPPSTSVEPAGSGPIFGASTLVSFSASDPGAVAAGVNRTDYALDNGVWSAYEGAFGLPEGVHEVSYRSVDNVGNAESARTASYRIDATPPQSALAIGSGVSLFGVDLLTPQTALTITAEDPVSGGLASGVEKILYAVDESPEQAYSGPFYLPVGAHTLRYRAIDRAGNVEEENLAPLSIGSFLADALAGIDSVTLSGGAGVVGTVRSNGAFSGSGKSSVTGEVTALTVSLTGKSAVSGAVTQAGGTLPQSGYDLAAARAWAQAHDNSAANPAEFLKQGVLTLRKGQSLTLPAGDYYLRGLRLRGRSILALAGTVNIFLDGPLTLRAGSRFNDEGQASDLWIVSADSGSGAHEESDGDDDIDEDEERAGSHGAGHAVCLSGKTRAAFQLYAPLSGVALSGKGQFAGRLLGKAVALSGKAAQPSTIALAARSRRPGAPQRLKMASGRKDGATATKVASSRIHREDPASRGEQAKKATAQAPATKVPGEAEFARSERRRPYVMPAFSLAAKAALGLVKPEGSVVRSAERSAVVIPEGAASSVLAVTLSPASSDETQSRRRREARQRHGLQEAGQGVEFGPEGARFTKPVTLELPFDRSAQGELAIHYWNPGAGQWEKLASSVDRQAGLVRAQTDHFSLYQVMASTALTPAAGAALAFGDVYSFPNPARPGQNPTIHVEAGSADRLELRFYDSAGALVNSAALDGSGVFEYTWDVSGVGSGVYIYVATASQQGAGRITKKGRLAVIR
jgi:hypothetical protein